MPIFSSKKHSQPAVGNPSAHSQQSVPPERSDPQIHSQPPSQQPQQQSQSQAQQRTPPYYQQPPEDDRYQRIGVSRSDTTSSHSIDRPPVNVAASVPAKESNHNPNADRRFSYATPHGKPSQPEPKKGGLLGRLGFGHSHREPSDPSHPPASKLSRTVSLREKRSPQPNRYSTQPAEDPNRQYWDSRQASSQNLPIANEADEDSDYDPYLVRDSPPLVPSKDHSPDNPHSQPGQSGLLPNPPLQRSNTDQDYHSGAGPDDFGQPDPALTRQGAPSGYQPYQNPQGNPQQPGVYQSFQPQGLAIQPPQHTGADPNVRVQYYQQQGDQPYPQLPRQSSQQQQQQDLQFLQPGRPSSQQSHPQGELPPSVRIVQQPLKKGEQELHLNTGRPPSAQQLNPPSPLVQNYSPYIPQGDQGQALERTSVEINPPQPPQQVQQSQQPQQQPQQPQQGSSMAPLMSSGKPQRPGELPKGALQHGREMSGLGQQQQFNQGQMQPPPPGYPGPPPGGPQQGQQYRPGQPQTLQQESDPTRNNTPPPRSATGQSEEDDGQFNQLVREHKELRDKYQKVKKYYFEKEAQVHSLQNTLARQRLSLSRTSLDDSEYATRFNRLDGLISQLAFNIRKNWRDIPTFLTSSVNREAIATGKQEMTAVGRAYISAWLSREVFDKYFHPDLDTGLSTQLKVIQTNVRRYVGQVQSAEEEENLSSKIITWRLTTLEGLVDQLRSPAAASNRATFIDTLNEHLIADFQRHLQEPYPPDLDGGVYMIVELAVNILQHLPCESRDVCIEYYLPGAPFAADTMKSESGIPPLTNPLGPPEGGDKDDRASFHSSASEAKDGAEDVGQAGAGASGGKDDKGARRSVLAGLMSGSKKPMGPTAVEKAKGASQVSLGVEGKEEKRVRMAVGLGVQVRGRSVLFKAPVYAA